MMSLTVRFVHERIEYFKFVLFLANRYLLLHNNNSIVKTCFLGNSLIYFIFSALFLFILPSFPSLLSLLSLSHTHVESLFTIIPLSSSPPLSIYSPFSFSQSLIVRLLDFYRAIIRRPASSRLTDSRGQTKEKMRGARTIRLKTNKKLNEVNDYY